MSNYDRLKQAAEKTAKKATARPTCNADPAIVDLLLDARKKVEEAETVYSAYEAVVVEKAYETYDRERNNNNYASSILAPGQKTNGVMVVYSDRFSALPIAAKHDVEQIDKDYANYTIETVEISVKKDAGKTISQENIDKLIAACDAAGLPFDTMFDVKMKIAPIEGFARVKNVPEAIRKMFKQAKPSVRLVNEDQKVI